MIALNDLSYTSNYDGLTAYSVAWSLADHEVFQDETIHNFLICSDYVTLSISVKCSRGRESGASARSTRTTGLV